MRVQDDPHEPFPTCAFAAFGRSRRSVTWSQAMQYLLISRGTTRSRPVLLRCAPRSPNRLHQFETTEVRQVVSLADVYAVPFSLGWHTPRANFNTRAPPSPRSRESLPRLPSVASMSAPFSARFRNRLVIRCALAATRWPRAWQYSSRATGDQAPSEHLRWLTARGLAVFRKDGWPAPVVSIA